MVCNFPLDYNENEKLILHFGISFNSYKYRKYITKPIKTIMI